MATVESQGTVVSVEDAGATAYDPINQVEGISGPDGTTPITDVSHLQSLAREKRAGLADNGQINLSILVDPADVGQLRCETLRTTRATGNFRILMTDVGPTTLDFAGYVLQNSREFALDDVVRGQITIEIDGAITVS